MSLTLIMGLGVFSIVIGVLGLVYGFKSKREKRDGYKEALLSIYLSSPESVSLLLIMFGVIAMLIIIIIR